MKKDLVAAFFRNSV